MVIPPRTNILRSDASRPYSFGKQPSHTQSKDDGHNQSLSSSVEVQHCHNTPETRNQRSLSCSHAQSHLNSKLHNDAAEVYLGEVLACNNSTLDPCLDCIHVYIVTLVISSSLLSPCRRITAQTHTKTNRGQARNAPASSPSPQIYINVEAAPWTVPLRANSL